MNCPVCRIGMIVVEYQGVELDHCVECGGVWFDRDELEFMLEAMNLEIENLNVKAASRKELTARNEKGRRCPLCKKRMEKLFIGKDSSIIIDRCKRHGGYWFDGGELPDVIRGNLPDGEWKDVIEFIGNLFPAEKIEKGES